MILSLITVGIYLVISFIYILNLWTGTRGLIKYSRLIITAGAIFHFFSVYQKYSSGFLQVNNLDDLLYLFSFIIVLVFLVYQLKSKTYVLGATIFPLVFLLTLPSIIIPSDLVHNQQIQNNALVLTNILLTFAGQAVFTIAFFAGLLYLFEQNKIKKKRISSILKKFPSISTLDNINNYCLLIGFPLLTIGLALGIVISKSTWGVLLRWQQKEIWAVITWFLYAFLIYGRLGAGWKGERAAIGAIIGFCVIIVTFIALGILYGNTP